MHQRAQQQAYEEYDEEESEALQQAATNSGAKPAPAGENVSLSAAAHRRALRLIINESYFGQTMITLTTGIFLVGLALQLHASNLVVGLLAAIPAFAQLAQIPAIFMVARIPSRKKITLISWVLSRLMLLPMAATPFLNNPKVALAVLFAGFTGYMGFNAAGACAWNSWMKDIVPDRELGAFFGKKLVVTFLVTLLFTALGGFFVSEWMTRFPETMAYVYSALFLIAFFIGMAGLQLVRRIEEPALTLKALEASQVPFWSALKKPLRDRNYRALIQFMTSWSFGVNLAAPFFMVYMLKMLNMPMSSVAQLTILNQVSSLVSVRVWGSLADRFGNKAVLRFCAPAFLFCILAWTFTTLPDQHLLTFPLVVALHIVTGIVTAGVTLASGNIAMKLAPTDDQTSYMATNNFLTAFAAGIAPILGGAFADFFARQELSLVLQWHKPGQDLALRTIDFHYWDFFFFLAFLVGLRSLSYLNRIDEGQDLKKRAVFKAFMQVSCESATCPSHRQRVGRFASMTITFVFRRAASLSSIFV